jgi:hypothetical protein
MYSRSNHQENKGDHKMKYHVVSGELDQIVEVDAEIGTDNEDVSVTRFDVLGKAIEQQGQPLELFIIYTIEPIEGANEDNSFYGLTEIALKGLDFTEGKE